MSKSIKEAPLDRLRRVLYTGEGQPAETLPKSVTGPLGTVPGAGIDTTQQVPEPRQLSDRQAEHLMRAEMIAAVKSLVESTTEITARLGRRGAINGVLDSWGGTFPAGNPSVLTRSYETPPGSIVIVNHSAAGTLTVQSGVAAGDTGPQAGGVGVNYVGPGQRHIMPLNDRSWTMSGTAGDKVSVQAFTGLQPYGVSVL